MSLGANKTDALSEPTLSFVIVLLGEIWKALEHSKPQSSPGIDILMFKLYKGFWSDDFAET